MLLWEDDQVFWEKNKDFLARGSPDPYTYEMVRDLHDLKQFLPVACIGFFVFHPSDS